jgi:FkbM family methyltransferase
MEPFPNADTKRELSRNIERVHKKFEKKFQGDPSEQRNNAVTLKVGDMFENILRRLYECILEPGDIAIDIGANYGMHTIPMANAVSPGGRVYAFEPVPLVYTSLERRIADEELGETIRLLKVALSNYSGRAKFVSVENDYGYSGLREKSSYPFEPNKKIIEVEVDTLDSRIPVSEKVKFIKIDIEGGELHALQGGVDLLRAQRPLVVFENSKDDSAKNYGYSPEDLFAFFQNLDYELYDILGCRMLLEHWQNISPWNTVACPRENVKIVLELLSTLVVEKLLDIEW